MRGRHKYLSIIVAFFILLLAVGCSSGVTRGVDEEKTPEQTEEDTAIVENIKHPIIQMEMENGGIMVFELYPEFAPETVDNFVALVESGFYDGLKFHRIIKGFMVQSGDPDGNGTGGSDKTITGEFAKNNFSQNTLKHTRGVISMARSKNPDSASSQFFIMDGTSSNLDGSYAAFGQMIEGDDVLSLIADTEVKKSPISGEKSVPVTDVFIKQVILLEYK